MIVGNAKLLLNGRGDETKGLGPAQVEEVAESAQEEDESPVPTHAHLAVIEPSGYPRAVNQVVRTYSSS